ncbi:MAG TPA: hypothetical protein VNC82_08685 [Candidatus Limnocylindria bacterium]|nr:hypothetical protein [Candidatus Limnocylindria bacterium]
MTHGIRGTHWGAIAFTLVAAAVVVTVSSTALRDAFASVPGVVTEESTKKPAASAAAAPSAAAPSPDQVSAALVRKTAPPVIFSGGVATIVYIFRNTGSAAWVKGTPAEARLGIFFDDRELFDNGMAVGWPHPTRPAVQLESVVEPGGTAQFSFRVKGTVPGRYQIQVAPVIDGVAWTEEAAPLDLTVREG